MVKHMSKSGLIPTRDVADLLGVTPRHVARLVEAGLLEPVVRMPGVRGALLFHEDDVQSLFEARQAS